MAYPLTNLATVRVVATYLDQPTGDPMTGTVVFEPLQSVRSVDDPLLLVANPFEVTLDFNGRVIVDLPVGDDPDFTPEFVYRVTEKIKTQQGGKAGNTRGSFLIQLGQAEIGHDFDLIAAYDSVVVDPGPEYAQYLLKTGGTITGNLVVAGTSNLSGATTTSSLTVAGNTTTSSLNVTGPLTAGSISGPYTPTGNLAVPGNLTVTGTTTNTGATTTGALTASSATVTGATTLNGNITGDGIYYNATTKRLTQGVAVNGGGLNTVVTNGSTYGAFSAENTGAGVNNFPGYDSITSTTDGRAYQARVAGEAAARLVVQSDGKILIGDGTNARDTNLYRSAADTWKTDDNLIVGANLNVVGNLTVTGTYPGSTSTYSVPWRRPARRYTGPITVVEDFQTGHGWTFSGSGTPAPNQTSTVGHHGTQVYRITTDNAGGVGIATGTGKTARDLSNKTAQVVLWVSINNSTQQVGQMTLRAAGTGGLAGNNYLSWNILSTATQTVADNQSHIENGVLVAVPLSLGDAVVTGSPAKSAITEWQLLVADRNNGTTLQFNFSGIEVRSNGLAEFGNNGIACFTFDDSMVGQYTIARQQMGRRGMVGTIFPIIDVLGTGGNYMAVTQVRALYYEGFEIGIHSYALTVHNSFGPATDTSAAWKADAVLAAQWSSDQGYGSTSYAYPSGVSGSTTGGGSVQYWRQASAFFDAARTVSSSSQALNPTPVINPMKLRAITVGGTSAPTVAQLVAAGGLIEKAATENAMIVFTIHNVIADGSGSTGPLQVTTTDLNLLLDAVKNAGMATPTIGQVLAATRV